MNNHEQALLALNICSHLGSAWEKSNLLQSYEPFKNIPEGFMPFPRGKNINDLFPEMRYEWEDRYSHLVKVFNFALPKVSILLKIKIDKL
ncbi:hypothetical protein D3C85_1310690 [compost metagenome]